LRKPRATSKPTPQKRGNVRKPHPGFEFTLLDEPMLLFAQNAPDTAPKRGLATAGPAGIGSSLHPSHILVGIVGTGHTHEKAKDFLSECTKQIPGSQNSPRQVPGFPGMNLDSPFRTDLQPLDSHLGLITTTDLRNIIGNEDYAAGFRDAVEMLTGKVQLLCESDSPPDVVICALPNELVDYCLQAGKTLASTTSPKDKLFSKLLKIEAVRGQGHMLADLFERDSKSDFVGRNLRRALKGRTMKWQRPIQIGLESSLFSEKAQPLATKAWNFCVALYYKAGGALPWKVEGLNPETCFIGISFYRHLLEESFEMHTSVAQVFTGEGEAFVLRGHKFHWDQKQGKTPHLDEAASESLMDLVLKKYSELKGGVPRRIVVHKTSRFYENELAGFRKGLRPVKEFDLLSIQQTGVRFFRSGAYPPLRGTLCSVNDRTHFLYTMGYMPELGTYPRGYVPEPWELTDHHGDNTPRKLFKETLALTKMNYNNADMADGEPITLKFARKVGEILSYIPENEGLHPSYRFYM
jgi:hypothetical protein